MNVKKAAAIFLALMVALTFLSRALDSFTVEGAHASFEEEVKGRIAPGMLADFVILGANPFETFPEELAGIPVEATYVAGVCRYSREAEGKQQ